MRGNDPRSGQVSPAALRDTGIDLIGRAPWGTHFCQFYDSKQDLIDFLVPYFKAGLENNEFCMWITSEPLRAREAREALGAAVKDLETRIRAGQVEILDHTEWYTVGGRFDSERVLRGWVEKLDAARAGGFDGLRLSGNTFWLEESDWRDFTEYEAAVDGVIGRYPMLAICTYSLRKCGAPEIMDVVSNHAFALVKRDGAWQAIESAERKRKEDELEEASRRKDEFLATLGHELRNPLAPIRIAAYALMKRAPDDPAIRRHCEVIERQVKHMVRLVDDLLDVSRIERGKIELRRERVDLARILTQAMEACRPLIEARRHRASLAPAQEPLFVDGDPTRLVQMVSNLVNNACKYTPPEGDIRVSVAREGGEAVVRVRDNGIGLTPDELAKVFEPFYQAASSPNRTEGGLGIGLTLVQRLANMHGGSLAAASDGPGAGSEFTLRLPALDRAADATPATPDR